MYLFASMLKSASKKVGGSRFKRTSGFPDDSSEDFQPSYRGLDALCYQLAPWYYLFKPAQPPRTHPRFGFHNTDQIVSQENPQDGDSRRPPTHPRPETPRESRNQQRGNNHEYHHS